MGPQNGVVGDNDFGLDLPQSAPEQADISNEVAMAKFTRTAEFKRLKEHAISRIDFYQKYLPDGRPLTDIPEAERGYMWLAANVIIGELQMLFGSYEAAVEVVKKAQEDARRADA
jgi:hypothetical protein